MFPKPRHLGPAYAAQFSHPSVIAAYHLRPPYPADLFDVLDRLIVDTPRAVLDLGTGTGEIARRLISRVDRVDAIDPSAGMLAKARQLPRGDHPQITWIHAPAEAATLREPYALVTVGASLHWMDWDIVLPRIHEVLSANGMLAIIDSHELPVPWEQPLRQLVERFSTNREYQPYDLIEELEQRWLFQRRGHQTTAPVPFTQSVADYMESFHARNGFSRDRMNPEAASAFDRHLGQLVRPHTSSGMVTLRVVGTVTWGTPGTPRGS